MITKFLEIRDDGTCIPVLAIQLDSKTDAERYLLARAGYGLDRQTQSTMREAHTYIKAQWDEIETGDVIDIEFILGETEVKKISERLKSFDKEET